ncbi:Gx transporter family protein [Streptococcus fryi]
MQRSHHKMVFIAMLASQAVVLSLIERLIPTPFAFAPGAKLGLGNLITLIAIFTLPSRDSLKIVLVRLIIATLLSGTFSSFMYSAAGSLLSYLVMLASKKLGPKRVSVLGISTLGGVIHNIGQIIVFAFLAQSLGALNYLPILSMTGILSGFLVGLTGYYLLQKIPVLHHYYQTMLKNW